MNKKTLERKAELWLKLRGLKDFPPPFMSNPYYKSVCDMCKFRKKCEPNNLKNINFVYYYKGKCISWLDTEDEV